MPKVNPNAKVNLWCGNQPNPDDRTRLSLSKADRAKFNAIPRDSNDTLFVYDIRTGNYYEIKHADCGLGCRCAAEVVSIQDYKPAKRKKRRVPEPCENCNHRQCAIVRRDRKRAAARKTNKAFEFVALIARMKTEEEFGDDGPSMDDTLDTLNNLIATARKIQAMK